jgi:hypothetical protein
MSDFIRREDATKAVYNLSDKLSDEMLFVDAVIDELENLPSAEPDSGEFEWCHDCKEYDQEKHCCHRWTKVIRKTVEEVKSQYALEYPKIIHCEDCKFYTPMNRALKTGICSLTMHHLGDDGFCSDAEKRGDR